MTLIFDLLESKHCWQRRPTGFVLQGQFHYFQQGGSVLPGVCLSVCLSVCLFVIDFT